MEGQETIKRIIENINDPTPNIKNISIKVSKDTAQNFKVSTFSVIICEYLYDNNTRINCIDSISTRGYILKEKNSNIQPCISKANDDLMKKEAFNLRMEKMELYRQLIYIYESGRVKFNLTKWGKYIRFNNI